MGNNQSNHFPHIPEKVTWSLNTIINGKSQTLLSDFFLRGGAAVHRLDRLRHLKQASFIPRTSRFTAGEI